VRRLAMPAVTIALLLSAACRHDEAVTGPRAAAHDAAPEAGSAAERPDDARVVDADEAKRSGVVVELGSAVRITGPQFMADVFAEFRPTELATATEPGGPRRVKCTVRLRRADGRDVGACHEDIPRARHPPRESGEGWTGLVEAGRDTVVYFDPPAVEPLVAHGWVLAVRAEPVGERHVRLRASGGAITYVR
jgi:hypothetical protein